MPYILFDIFFGIMSMYNVVWKALLMLSSIQRLEIIFLVYVYRDYYCTDCLYIYLLSILSIQINGLCHNCEPNIWLIVAAVHKPHCKLLSGKTGTQKVA